MENIQFTNTQAAPLSTTQLPSFIALDGNSVGNKLILEGRAFDRETPSIA